MCAAIYLSPFALRSALTLEARGFLDLSHSHDIAAQKGDRRRHPRVNQKCGVVILAWLQSAGRPPAGRVACRPRSTKTCISRSSFLLPSRLAVDLGCWPYPLSYSFAPKTFAVLPLGGRQSEINSSDPPRLPSLQPPLPPPLVAQSDDSSNVRMTQPAPGPVDPGISLGRPPFHWLP